MKKIELKIRGMHCSSCELLIRDSLKEIGVKSKVDRKKGFALVEFDENKITLEEIKKKIKEEGYNVE